jgi:hypothetical protein
MGFDGANPMPKIVGEQKQPGTVGYYVGSNPKEWLTKISSYGRIRYHHIYPGIDLVFSRNRGQLAYELRLAPGADPNSIRSAHR